MAMMASLINTVKEEVVTVMATTASATTTPTVTTTVARTMVQATRQDAIATTGELFGFFEYS